MKKFTSIFLSIFITLALIGSLYSVSNSANAQVLDNSTTSSFNNATSIGTNNSTSLSTNNTQAAAPESTHAANTTSHHTENASATVTRDSQTILLEDKHIPAGSFIHLYDATPYKITNGHVAAKLPCNEANQSSVNILLGQAPNLKPAELEFIAPLSTPGDLCMYHADIAPTANETITDIAIQNNSTDGIDFPSTSTIVIGVNEIVPLGEHDHHE